MIKEIGYCSGIENYSRHMDGREPGTRPYCLLDYFQKNHGDDWQMVIDESHVTVPQVRGMYNGDRARKLNLVEHGFRLPSAMDNRPLTFEEFETFHHNVTFVTATPGRLRAGAVGRRRGGADHPPDRRARPRSSRCAPSRARSTTCWARSATASRPEGACWSRR